MKSVKHTILLKCKDRSWIACGRSMKKEIYYYTRDRTFWMLNRIITIPVERSIYTNTMHKAKYETTS